MEAISKLGRPAPSSLHSSSSCSWKWPRFWPPDPFSSLILLCLLLLLRLLPCPHFPIDPGRRFFPGLSTSSWHHRPAAASTTASCSRRWLSPTTTMSRTRVARGCCWKAFRDWRRWRLHLDPHWPRTRKPLCASDRGACPLSGKRLLESHPEMRPFALQRITRSDLSSQPPKIFVKDGYFVHIIPVIS